MDKPTGDFKARFNKAISKQNIKPIELSEKTGISKSAISHLCPDIQNQNLTNYTLYPKL